MTSRAELRDEFYATVLGVIQGELPGIRGDLQRRISRDIAQRLSGQVHAAFEDKARLERLNRDLSSRLERVSKLTPGVGEIQQAITALEAAKRKLFHGEAH